MSARLVCALCALLFAATVLAAGLRISIFTNPKTYLKAFPLGVAQAEVYEALGAPASTLDMGGGVLVWVYAYGEGYGARKYSFEIADGKVREVRYNDQGPWNGLTATQMQAGTAH